MEKEREYCTTGQQQTFRLALLSVLRYYLCAAETPVWVNITSKRVNDHFVKENLEFEFEGS